MLVTRLVIIYFSSISFIWSYHTWNLSFERIAKSSTARGTFCFCSSALFIRSGPMALYILLQENQIILCLLYFYNLIFYFLIM